MGFDDINQLKILVDEAKSNLKAFADKQGIPMIADIGTELGRVFPGIQTKINCPHCGAYTYMYYILVDLNDDHGWTREQIADWLDTLDIDLTASSGSYGH